MISECNSVDEAKAMLQKELDFCEKLEQKNGGCQYRGGILCSQCGAQKLLKKMITGINDHD